MMIGRGRESNVEEFNVWEQRIRLTPKQVISRGWSRKKSVSVVELNEWKHKVEAGGVLLLCGSESKCGNSHSLRHF